MAISKVDFDGKTLIDLTADTVTAADLRRGVTAHDKAGNIITGILTPSGGGTKIQMVSGTMPNYEHGELKIENLPFKPVMVVVAFDASKKKEPSTFFSVGIDSKNFLNNSIGFGEFSASWANFVWASTVKSNATFTANSVTLTPVVDNSGTISNVKWWVFGGYSI